jgi:hypothetical protein
VNNHTFAVGKRSLLGARVAANMPLGPTTTQPQRGIALRTSRLIKAATTVSVVAACAVAPSGASAATSSGWQPVASQGQTFSVSGLKKVRYGADGSYVETAAQGTVYCANQGFGTDPKPGVQKKCEVSQTTTYTRLVPEGFEFFTFKPMIVVYGGSKWVEQATVNGAGDCANYFFAPNFWDGSQAADPDPGHVKTCWVETPDRPFASMGDLISGALLHPMSYGPTPST